MSASKLATADDDKVRPESISLATPLDLQAGQEYNTDGRDKRIKTRFYLTWVGALEGLLVGRVVGRWVGDVVGL